MNRKEFIQKSAILGLGMPFLAHILGACTKENVIEANFKGKVLIVGAGSAGMMAGYILNKYGIDFQIIEASSVFGGRVKKTNSFADFPIDLGAEWIHDTPDIFSRLMDGEPTEGRIDMLPYNPETVYLLNNDNLTKVNLAGNFYGEYKFKNATWYDFFDTYIIPEIKDKIVYDSPIIEVDYSSDQVSIKDIHGNSFVADKVIITVPTPILQSNMISFVPNLPQAKTDALKTVFTPEGIKVFIEFSEKFYPDIVSASVVDDHEEKIFYNAAFKKDSSRHILGLFTIGAPAAVYTNMSSEADIIQQILAELDAMFEGKASASYLNHIIQNWSAEEFIQGSYTHFSSNEEETMAIISDPLDNKVFFAGEALSPYSSATVQGAALSAKSVAEKIIQEG